ncbi:hypothetical protein [Streptomyces sp. NPDC092903]|uniref:hypothetical protein n=1 Tax=Streptomyces sp. NPDC092903 TaxID=3366017 RepID=UPI00380AFA31
MSGGWHMAIADLRAQGGAARAGAERVDELNAGGSRETRLPAIAVRDVAEADYLRSAQALLRAHLADRRPPRRLPVARMWPCFRDVWQERALNRLGGLWRAVPGPAAVARMRAEPPEPLLESVIEQAEALRASLHGHRRRDRLYESYVPDRGGPIDEVIGRGRSAPTLPGVPDPGHLLNRAFRRGGQGMRIQPARLAEFNQLTDDRRAVHERAIAFGDAVLALLVAHRLDGVTPQTGRLLGAGPWVAREEVLIPRRPKWPAKLNVFQIATLAGAGWLVLACTGLPLTFGMRAALLSHVGWLFAAAALITCTGVGIITRYMPKLIQAPGPRAAVPGIAAGLIALVVWQGQAPLAEHFFAGPYDRYDREYATGCLAASPYRRDAVRATADDGVLVVTPISGETTLRLGPAKKGGIHPLRPLDQATREVLDRYGC